MKFADTLEDFSQGDFRHFNKLDLEDEDQNYFANSEEEEREALELKECTFKPNINKHNVPARSVDDLIEWGKLKHHRMLETKIQINCFDPNNFQPFVNPNSKKITGRRKGNIEDRLLKRGEENKETLKKKREDATKGLFQPLINEKSKLLAGKKNRGGDEEFLKKTLTARDGRADYYVTEAQKQTGKAGKNLQDTKASNQDYKVDPM